MNLVEARGTDNEGNQRKSSFKDVSMELTINCQGCERGKKICTLVTWLEI
jgi:hypothetical protein